MIDSKTTVLCSGVALGVYIPAMLVDNKLKNNRVPTDVVVLENLLKDEKISRIRDNKKAFHNNFRFALTGQKMATDLLPSCDNKKINAMLDGWENEDRRNFIVFSGFWMPVIVEYAKRLEGKRLNIDIIHMDADISASWKNFAEESSMHNYIWLFRWYEKKLDYKIPVNNEQPVLWGDRNGRLVVHGGGWGMGTYQTVIPELENEGFLMDIVAYDVAEASGNEESGNRYFMIDPSWSPWMKNAAGFHEFPPFCEIKKGESPAFRNKPEHHELYDVISVSSAVVSKPGGATLLDSLSSATPLVMLDPFGDYEKKNAELWEYLGFGIYYEEWKESGFSLERLSRIHANLLNAGCGADYISDYIIRNSG